MNLDVDKLHRQLLPTFLRSEKGIVLFLDAFASAFKTLLNRFETGEESDFYNLSITPQICYLEKALNDRYDKYPRRIYITDGVPLVEPYLFQAAEQQPLYIFTASENQPQWLWQSNEAGGYKNGIAFIINVPADILENTTADEITGFVGNYKLAGKNCVVVSG
jgi:hypothetical protein